MTFDSIRRSIIIYLCTLSICGSENISYQRTINGAANVLQLSTSKGRVDPYSEELTFLRSLDKDVLYTLDGGLLISDFLATFSKTSLKGSTKDELCLNHTTAVIQSLKDKQTWALPRTYLLLHLYVFDWRILIGIVICLSVLCEHK